MSHSPSQGAGERRFPCSQCGAELAFAPGVSVLRCGHCGTETEIPVEVAPVEELDFRSHVTDLAARADTVDRIVSRCHMCGAEVEFPENVTSHACPFCSSNVVATGRSVKVIRPRSLLPFAVEERRAREAYRAWMSKLWFAPSDLKKMARVESHLSGVYLPFWTYDCDVTTDYRGQRGEHYWDTEHYTTRDSQGRTQHHTRQVRKTRWYPARGRVFNEFDDVLVAATGSLDRNMLEKLEPWDLDGLVPYEDAFLAGFRSESYAIDLASGFTRAQELMDPHIRATIRSDIGGDEQQISWMQPHYNGITFKHLLLPVWILAYRYGNKSFQVLVNARTGEVIGTRPYSAWKIATLVACILLAAGLVLLIVAMSR
ncbi:MAG: hypothetical protein DYG94_11160 [Leptolyngbya sp. PLA3]|nr:MAG: hypothetical protein EDM82_10070 [Cyanobacteria bacterium CYA]MCE7969287.1 hypothetical protein [Leptolyngbya sp. PL-A3]